MNTHIHKGKPYHETPKPEIDQEMLVRFVIYAANTDGRRELYGLPGYAESILKEAGVKVLNCPMCDSLFNPKDDADKYCNTDCQYDGEEQRRG